jgi:hypothetical protein
MLESKWGKPKWEKYAGMFNGAVIIRFLNLGMPLFFIEY